MSYLAHAAGVACHIRNMTLVSGRVPVQSPDHQDKLIWKYLPPSYHL